MRPPAAETDTIAAIATPPGEGGLAVLRVSGPAAFAVAERVFLPSGRHALPPSQAASHTLHYGHIHHAGRRIDEVMVAVLRAPRTFTREDVVEISCHGGAFVSRQVLDALLAAGARLALPGEFTRRAFLNGRLDLTQAEAVADLIHARTELALAAANEQLGGSLSRRVNTIRDDLMRVLAHVEAHIDFPEEDIAPDTRSQLLARIDQALQSLDALMATARQGQVLRRGIRAAIIGRPNAGKSSLLNQLLGHDRAIVSPIAGTTRDTVEETANVRGLPVVFIDTAGLRQGTDDLEQEGIRRTRLAASRAELILHVIDGSEPFDANTDARLRELADRSCVVVLNKADLPRRCAVPADLGPIHEVSCATGEGIEALKAAIAERVWCGQARPSVPEATLNARHEDALRRGRQALAHCREALRSDAPLDLVAVDLRISVQAVGEIAGRTATEDLLDVIFSQFCLGK